MMMTFDVGGGGDPRNEMKTNLINRKKDEDGIEGRKKSKRRKKSKEYQGGGRVIEKGGNRYILLTFT